ncbi:MAG: glutaredoxin family protein [Proteobacteria bacterium]|nr:glutaredoxin family protein [Pseudomonadota bacterium]
MKLEQIKKLGAVKIGLLGGIILIVAFIAADQIIVYAFDPTGRYGNKIIMYGTNTCSYCARLRKCFSKSNVAYQEKDINGSLLAGLEFTALRAKGVPVVVIGEDVVYGYGIKKINEILLKSNRELSCKEI